MSRAVLFDLDGTLLDTLDDLTDAVNHIMEKYSFPKRDRFEVRGFLGNGAVDLMRAVLPNDIDEEYFFEIFSDYRCYYQANSCHKTRPYDGVLKMLDQLKRKGYMTAVVSNKPDPAVGVLCKKYFGDLIDVALGDKEGILRKPSAEPVKYAIEKLGCESAVFVGDTEVDVATAKNAGLDCIAMTWGFRDRDQLEASGATVFADDADELMTHILSLLGE